MRLNFKIKVCISIHAPASGATSILVNYFIFIIISIHAPASGATSLTLYGKSTQIFQSTLPRVERQRRSTDWGNGRNFNPRSREWSDVTKACFEPCLKISIHAPASGATLSGGKIFMGIADFNPRSREWSDIDSSHSTLLEVNFNPRSREWSDLLL